MVGEDLKEAKRLEIVGWTASRRNVVSEMLLKFGEWYRSERKVKGSKMAE